LTVGGEVIRFLGRHGTSRASKAIIVGAIPPLMLKTEANPQGTPKEVFDGYRAAMIKDRAQFFRDVPSAPFFNFNREGVQVSQGLIESWYQQGMACSFKGAYDCITVFSETDMTEDMKKIDIPVCVIHGDDDQVCPIIASAYSGIKLLKKGTLKVYPGGAHALPNTEIDKLNQDILDFIETGTVKDKTQ
jgi:non-heme chloroperoxidase